MSTEAPNPRQVESFIDGPEIDPAAYLSSIREVMATNYRIANGPASPKIGAQMYFEEEKSREYVLDNAGSTSEPELGWLSDGFSSAMSRLTKVTARSANADLGVLAFGSLSEQARAAVREQFFTEYKELCGLLSSNGKPSKTLYLQVPILYQSPQSARELIETNEEFRLAEIAHILMSYPSSPQPVLDEIKAKLPKAIEQFPTVPLSEVRRIVVASKDSYQNSLRDYAKKEGLVVDVPVGNIPEVSIFFDSVRSLIRTRKHNVSHLNSSPEVKQKAKELGSEALTIIDDIVDTGQEQASDPEYRILREGFKNKIELLAATANRAWRKGDLPISLEQAPIDFRKELYTQAFANYLTLFAEFGGGVSDHTIKHNPVLYHTPDEVRAILERNSDLAITYLRPLIIRNPTNPDEAITDFRDRVQQIMQANPRYLTHEAMRIALERPRKDIEGEVSSSEKLSPTQLLGAVREALRSGTRLGTGVSRDIKFEMQERGTELQRYFEGQNWTFNAVQLPDEARPALLKKASEFIIANERGYRKQQIPTRLRDYTAAERTNLYQLIGEDFSQIAAILEVVRPVQWQTLPVLYVSPQELADLKVAYDWLSERQFDEIVRANSDIAGALNRATQLKVQLCNWYPGVSEALAAELAVQSPLSADSRVIDVLKKAVQRDCSRFDSRTTTPNPAKPAEVYTHLRTIFRKRGRAYEWLKDSEETRIQELEQRAAVLITRAEKDLRVDRENLQKLKDQVGDYARKSAALNSASGYPNILTMPATTQNRIIEAIYLNQKELNIVLKTVRATDDRRFVAYEFGFFHNAKYLERLWERFDPYFSHRIIAHLALKYPLAHVDKLASLVEYRASLVKADPEITVVDINKAVALKAKAL